MPVPRPLFVTVLLLTLSGVGSAQSPREAAAQDPNWFEKLLQREAEPIEERRLASDDGTFESRVAATILSKPKLIEDVYYVQLGLGTDVPMECWLFPEGTHPAAAHRRFSNHVFRSIAASYGGVELKAVQRIDAGVFGAHPYLALDWVYRVKTPQGPLPGQVKHLTARKGEASVYCLHNETGYSKTFERVFRGLVDRLELSGAAAEPYYQEILVLHVGRLKTGIASTTLTLDERGDTRIAERFSLLLPTDEQTLMASDSYNLQSSSPDGWLLKEVDFKAENGEATTQLQLDPNGDAWKVSGLFKSKSFERALAPERLHSTLGQMLALREFLASARAGDALTFPEWSSDADPATFTEVRVEVRGRGADGVAARLDLGPVTMDVLLDDNGSMKSAKFNMGAVETELRRVHVQGAVPSP